MSKASQLSLLAIVILMGAIFFTVNTALQQQSGASHASGTGCVVIAGFTYCPNQPTPTPTPFALKFPTPSPITIFGQICHLVWTGVTYQMVCYVPTPTPVMSGPTATPNPQFTPTPTSITCLPPPSCYSGGLMICTVTYNGSCAYATPTPKPTVTQANPTPTPFSPTQVPQPTNAPQPTAIPVPTNTPVPGSTVLSFNVALHGIGMGGDSANPNSQGNTNPSTPSRTVTVDIYDVQNQLVTSQQGSVEYNQNSGRFAGTVNLGSQFATGLYTVKVKTDQYLRAIVPGIQTITAGQTTSLPQVTLIAGDINGDNAINIIDYNILIGCYSDLLPAVDCSAENNVLADITDDGHVNQYDYNLFLRELTNIGGQ